MMQAMGELVGSQLVRAVRAFADRDSELASDVAERDERVDVMEVEIRDYAVRLPAGRQPMARNLRFVVAATSIATDLERSGDSVRNVAERTIEVDRAQHGNSDRCGHVATYGAKGRPQSFASVRRSAATMRSTPGR